MTDVVDSNFNKHLVTSYGYITEKPIFAYLMYIQFIFLRIKCFWIYSFINSRLLKDQFYTSFADWKKKILNVVFLILE